LDNWKDEHFFLIKLIQVVLVGNLDVANMNLIGVLVTGTLAACHLIEPRHGALV
jgi:hypothetical protein